MAEPTLDELAENINNPRFGDDRLGVRFYLRTVEDHERTLAEGRKCFRDREYVQIMVPGDRHNVVDRAVQMTGMEATDDRMRFPKQYAKFKLNQEQRVHDGLPLSAWPGIPSALAEELRFLNIFTVEQLAELADTYVSKIHGGHEWKRKAKEFSTALKDQAAVNKLQAQLAERDNRIEVLERNLAELTAKVDAAAKQRR